MGDPQMSRTYRAVMACAAPIVRGWGRLEVVGDDRLPTSGPTLLLMNHDSYWDPVVIGVAARPRRQIRALAKSSLWKYRVVGRVLTDMGQIPVDRGRGDREAMAAVIERLRAGECIGVFPEGTTSCGMPTRVHSGAGRLALNVPDAHVVCGRVIGSVDLVRFPKRPRLLVEFFDPAGGQPQEGESAIALSRRWTGEIRQKAPYAVPGRRKKAAQYRALAAARARKDSTAT